MLSKKWHHQEVKNHGCMHKLPTCKPCMMLPQEKGMDHVSKNRCHEKEIHYGNGGLGHMGMEKKDMAMQRRTNQTRTMGACVHEKTCMRTITKAKDYGHVNKG